MSFEPTRTLFLRISGTIQTVYEIYMNQGQLSWDDGERLATLEEVILFARTPGSIWESINEGDYILLSEGIFCARYNPQGNISKLTKV